MSDLHVDTVGFWFRLKSHIIHVFYSKLDQTAVRMMN